MMRSASHDTTQPPPSSVAPAPTSHESRWPLTTTISSGRSRPRISPTTLADSTSGSKWRLHPKADDDAVVAVGHALQPVGVLAC